MTASQARPKALEDLVDSFIERRRRGERPTLDDYARAHPELAAEIRDLFPALDLMEELGPAAARATTPAPPRPGPPAGDGIPTQLGEYRILREVGRGGMGIVYEAMQESLGRRVALKVLPPHAVLHPHYLERFRREAQAAARLHHSNIVPVFGVGAHHGIHFLALQFIDGQPLDAVLKEVQRFRNREQAPKEDATLELHSQLALWLLTGRFSLEKKNEAPAEAAATPAPQSRTTLPAGSAAPSALPTSASAKAAYFRSVAEIGAQVADALAYAHKHGVVHRDIKPSNLMLDGAGVVWVADFGLAKAEGTADLTTPGDIMGTLRYMAPEQLEGQADGRSDLYSLGITLYELATLTPAFADPLKARLIDRVKQEEPARPRKLEPTLPVDLETILVKATAKEPGKRYASAEALAADLRSFLGDRPIRARPVPWWEPGWRWCRRNTALAILAALLVLSLLVGTAVSATFALAASRERNEARAAQALTERDFQELLRVVDAVVLKTADVRLKDTPYMEPFREQMLKEALGFFQNMRQARPEHPALRRRLADAQLRIARIQRMLGKPHESLTAADAAADELRALAVAQPGDRTLTDGLAQAVHLRASALLMLNRFADMEAPMKESLALCRALAAAEPADPTHARKVASATLGLARCLAEQQRLPEAITTFAEAIATLRIPLLVNDADARQLLAIGLHCQGFYLGDLSLNDEAISHLHESVALFDRLVQGKPNDSALRYDRAVAHRDLGEALLVTDERQEAVAVLTEAKRELARLALLHPAQPQHGHYLADAQFCLGRAFRSLRQDEAAARELAEAIAELEKIPAAVRNPRTHPFSVGMIRLEQARLEKDRGRTEAAQKRLQDVIALLAALVAAWPEDARALHELGLAEGLLAEIALVRKQPALAKEWALKASAHQEQALAQFPRNLTYLRSLYDHGCVLTLALQNAGATDDEEAAHRQLIARLRVRRSQADADGAAPQATAEIENQLAGALHNIAACVYRQGQIENALALVREALGHQRKAVAVRPQRRSYVSFLQKHHGLIAFLLRQLGRRDEADAAQEAAIAEVSQLLAEHPESAVLRGEVATAWFFRAGNLDKDGLAPQALHAYRQATRHQQDAVRAAPGDEQAAIYLAHYLHQAAGLFLKAGDHAEAARLLAEAPTTVQKQAIRSAELWMMTARAAGADEKLPEAERTKLTRDFGDHALAALRAAVKLGYRNATAVRQSKLMEPLRTRPEWAELLKTMENAPASGSNQPGAVPPPAGDARPTP